MQLVLIINRKNPNDVFNTDNLCQQCRNELKKLYSICVVYHLKVFVCLLFEKMNSICYHFRTRYDKIPPNRISIYQGKLQVYGLCVQWKELWKSNGGCC